MKTYEVFSWQGYVCAGSRLPLELPKLAIVNSSQSKYPRGGDEWILGTQEALHSYTGKGMTLIGSLGMNTWEMVTWAGGAGGYPLIITVLWDGACDPITLFNDTINDFALTPESAMLLLLPVQKKRIRESGPDRDLLITTLADTLVPVSIRLGGRMESLLKAPGIQEKIDSFFRREWMEGSRNNPYRFDITAVKRDLDSRVKGWLIHWTRACQGPWPGETRAEYYRSITENWEEYAHSARKTLGRIVEERRIRSSSWRISGKENVVCFSGLPPSQATSLMRWRSRYTRYTIEPYGIGIAFSASERVGIKPVWYWDDRTGIPDRIPAFLLQGIGSSGDWPREDEYRHQGDIDLDALSLGEWEPINLERCRIS